MTTLNMSKAEVLRVLVNERLTAAVEEICGLFERTIAEYEEQLRRSKQDNERQRRQLDAVLQPEVRLHRADPELVLESRQIKEEQEQLWSGQEGEQIEALVFLKREEEEKPQSSQLHQGQAEEDKEGESPISDGDDSGQPADPERADISDDNYEQNRELESDLEMLKNSGDVDDECSTEQMFLRCSQCGKIFNHEDRLQSYVANSSGEKAAVCSVCVQGFPHSSHLVTEVHTGEERFSCPVCDRQFKEVTSLTAHMKSHMEERPFSCSLCPKRFIRSGVLVRHMRVHTGEKPYCCSVCNSRFTLSHSLSKHMRIHTGEKPFSCPVCGKKFTQKGHVAQHMPLHTGERSFSCHDCGKKFSRRSRLKTHKCITESSSRK